MAHARHNLLLQDSGDIDPKPKFQTSVVQLMTISISTAKLEQARWKDKTLAKWDRLHTCLIIAGMFVRTSGWRRVAVRVSQISPTLSQSVLAARVARTSVSILARTARAKRKITSKANLILATEAARTVH
jgi:hypothetical protein